MKYLAAIAGVLQLLSLPGVVAHAASPSAYDFSFPSIDGGQLKLADWRGKVLLVVNTASLCGYTKQYAGLQQLWSTYESQGLVVVGIPSNDFGGQEPKAEGDIKSFCQGAFGVTFPLTSKQAVVGPNAHPFYQWASADVVSGGPPAWNFHKYLIGRDGRLVRAFPSTLTPASHELTGWIEKTLGESR